MQLQKFLSTYRAGKEIRPFDFYILNKGRNSGKPLNAPCPNCFAFKCDNYEQHEYFYWLVYALWQSRSFHPFLKGSCVEFITIDDADDIIKKAYYRSRERSNEYRKACGSLMKIQKNKALITEQLKNMEEIQRHLLRNVLEM